MIKMRTVFGMIFRPSAVTNCHTFQDPSFSMQRNVLYGRHLPVLGMRSTQRKYVYGGPIWQRRIISINTTGTKPANYHCVEQEQVRLTQPTPIHVFTYSTAGLPSTACAITGENDIARLFGGATCIIPDQTLKDIGHTCRSGIRIDSSSQLAQTSASNHQQTQP